MRIVCNDVVGRRVYASEIKKFNEEDIKESIDCLYQYTICIYEQINVQDAKQAVIYVEDSKGRVIYKCDNPNDEFEDWKWEKT